MKRYRLGADFVFVCALAAGLALLAGITATTGHPIWAAVIGFVSGLCTMTAVASVAFARATRSSNRGAP